MYILPAIDLYNGMAVRLLKGDYSKMTVYSTDPLSVAKDFESAGAGFIHIVDLEGAESGAPANFETIASIAKHTSLKIEVGGGIRSEETIRTCLDAGIDRVILGTAVITDWNFYSEMTEKYSGHIAAGADIRNGNAAIRGWKETSDVTCFELCEKLESTDTAALICTDISRDGAMMGTNRELYRELTSRYSLKIIASGGISSMADLHSLKEMGLYGAIIGKACYTGALDLKEVIREIQ